jgi:hypothetical protein
MPIGVLECRLCGGRADFAFNATILGVHLISYYRCGDCKSLETEPPFWLGEAYDGPDTHFDFGIVQRNLCNQAACWLVSRLWGLRDALDYGGGDGLLCRMVRDHGINCYVWDKYHSPTYARTFTQPDFAEPQLIFCFEVFEHFAEPRLELPEVFTRGAAVILASTGIYRGQSSGWSYLAPRGGQHVFFYSPEAIGLIAERFGYEVTIGGPYILFVRRGARRPLARAMFKALTGRFGLRALCVFMAGKRAGGVAADSARMRQSDLAETKP